MENTGSQRRNHNIAKKSSKPMSRRSQTRRVLRDCVINMAEARREIVQALQLHRSSLSSKERRTTGGIARTTSATVTTDSVFDTSSQCCYYSLTQSMPVPEPIWSTTAPAIRTAAPPAGAMGSLEFEWGESYAAAYSWWLGFLKTLDSNKNMNNDVENSKYQQHLEKFLTGNSSSVLGYQDSSKLVEEQTSYPDEWLMIPTTSDDPIDHPTTTNI